MTRPQTAKEHARTSKLLLSPKHKLIKIKQLKWNLLGDDDDGGACQSSASRPHCACCCRVEQSVFALFSSATAVFDTTNTNIIISVDSDSEYARTKTKTSSPWAEAAAVVARWSVSVWIRGGCEQQCVVPERCSCEF